MNFYKYEEQHNSTSNDSSVNVLHMHTTTVRQNENAEHHNASRSVL